MLNFSKAFSLVFVALLALFLSIETVEYLSEKYFFDKVLYQKSARYGYARGLGYGYDDSNKYILERVADLMELKGRNVKTSGSILTFQSGMFSNVLGVKTQDVYKVVVIGDSFTYGAGIKNEERFSIRLAKELNKIRPTRVYALAFSGDDVIQYATNYELAERKIQPDLVILTMVNNDFQVHVTDDDIQEKETLTKLKDQCLGDILWLNWNEDGWNSYVSDLLYPATQDEYANSCMLSKAIARMDKAKTLFFTMEPLSTTIVNHQNSAISNEEVEEDYKIDQIMQKYLDVVISQNGYVLQFDYSKIPDNLLRVSKHEAHYSAYTNGKIADFLYEEIVGNSRWKFYNYD